MTWHMVGVEWGSKDGGGGGGGGVLDWQLLGTEQKSREQENCLWEYNHAAAAAAAAA